MTVTGRIPARKSAAKSETAKYLATCSGNDVSRHARVEELRQLVADGRYHVDCEQVAVVMLRRALKVREE